MAANVPTVDSSVRLFLSYCHADLTEKRDLVRRLSPRLRLLTGVRLDWWDDSLLETGVRWQDEILTRLGESDYGLLLLSFDFYASAFITQRELPCFVGSAAERGALPVALKRVPLDDSFELHGVPAHQMFTLEGKAFAELNRSYQKDQFATELASRIRSRVLADAGADGWRHP